MRLVSHVGQMMEESRSPPPSTRCCRVPGGIGSVIAAAIWQLALLYSPPPQYNPPPPLHLHPPPPRATFMIPYFRRPSTDSANILQLLGKPPFVQKLEIFSHRLQLHPEHQRDPHIPSLWHHSRKEHIKLWTSGVWVFAQTGFRSIPWSWIPLSSLRVQISNNAAPWKLSQLSD